MTVHEVPHGDISLELAIGLVEVETMVLILLVATLPATASPKPKSWHRIELCWDSAPKIPSKPP